MYVNVSKGFWSKDKWIQKSKWQNIKQIQKETEKTNLHWWELGFGSGFHLIFKMELPRKMSSSSIFCWLASVAIAAIVLQNSINEGGGSSTTLNGDPTKISPDNIQKWAGPGAYLERKREKRKQHCISTKMQSTRGGSWNEKAGCLSEDEKHAETHFHRNFMTNWDNISETDEFFRRIQMLMNCFKILRIIFFSN